MHAKVLSMHGRASVYSLELGLRSFDKFCSLICKTSERPEFRRMF